MNVLLPQWKEDVKTTKGNQWLLNHATKSGVKWYSKKTPDGITFEGDGGPKK